MGIYNSPLEERGEEVLEEIKEFICITKDTDNSAAKA